MEHHLHQRLSHPQAGSTAVQEVAFTLANGIAYVQQAIDAGLDVDRFAGQLSFFFNAHNNFLEEVAKFRAARRMWATIMRQRFGAQKPESWRLRFHTQTGGSTLTAQQADNNIVRVTLQALARCWAARKACTPTRATKRWPCPPSTPSRSRCARSRSSPTRAARRTRWTPRRLLLHRVADRRDRTPANAYIARIDELGGALAAVEQGYIQREIQEAAYKTQRAIEKGDQVVVGVNRFQTDEVFDGELLRVDGACAEQTARLQRLRRRHATTSCTTYWPRSKTPRAARTRR